MTLWFWFALITAAVIFSVLWPLRRAQKDRGAGSDVAVYRDQLTEIRRDRLSGLIGEAEAKAAQVEISRRLLAAADAADARSQNNPATDSLRRRRVVALVTLVGLPLGTFALYLLVGSPNLPAQPLAARLNAPLEKRSISGPLRLVGIAVIPKRQGQIAQCARADVLAVAEGEFAMLLRRVE